MTYPKMMRLRQRFDAPTLTDIPAAVKETVAKLNLKTKVRPGQTVAISAGSRGIANLALIVKSLVAELKALGLSPFVVPAMGSHGGGTAEGQKEIVESYGVTEAYTGAPIQATMEVVQISQTEDGVPVFFDKYASEADHVIVLNRVKLHTDFQGKIQSGLFKMMLIGLGKHHGAAIYHQAIVKYDFDRIIRSVGQEVIERGKVLFGLAIVENPADQTALVEAVPPDKFLEREMALLDLATQWMPRLPFRNVDLLIVDEIGKNISGTGLDTNVVGRKTSLHRPHPHEVFKVLRIFARELTEETHGNATGIGVADFTRTDTVRKIDFHKTYINCLTGNEPKDAAIPIHFPTDREVLDQALKTVGLTPPEKAKVVRIKNTLHLTEVLVSEAYLDEIKTRDDLTILEPAKPMEFDDKGNLRSF